MFTMAEPLPSSQKLVSLTPTQEHYLKKELISIQLTREVNKLSPTYNDTSGLRRFGPPFKMYNPRSPPPNLSLSELNDISNSYINHFNTQFPLLRFFFNEYLVSFPFIKAHIRRLGEKQKDEFWCKLQVFWEIWKSKNISNSNDRGELSKRKLFVFKFESFLVMFFNSSFHCIGDEEYFKTSDERNTYKKMSKLRIDGNTELKHQNDLNLDEIAGTEDQFIDGLDINVAGVSVGREIKSKFLFGSSESKFFWFIIRVKVEKTGKVWYIKRRYSQFVGFDKEIFRLYPGNDIPFLPSKNKAEVDIEVKDDDGFDESDNENENKLDISKLEKSFMNSLKLTKTSEYNGNDDDDDDMEDQLKFPRENLRVSLRGYLRNLASIKVIRNSPEFMKFLSGNKIEPTLEELQDIELRSKLDYLLVLQHFKFQQETIKAVKQIESSMTELKEETFKDGFGYIFHQLETKETISQLTKPLQALIQLIQIEVASTLYELFIGNDSARETLLLMKRLHNMFPYKIVSTILRFTNPIQIVKKLIDLFTYQIPLGFNKKAKSLLQVIFTNVLDDDLKNCNNELKLIKDKLIGMNSKYSVIVDKIEEYFTCSDETILEIKKNCQFYKTNICITLLQNNNKLKTKIPNELLADLIKSFQKSSENSKEGGLSKDTLYSLTAAFFKNYLRKHDKISLRQLWEEPELIALVKDLLSIFFQPLIKLFKRAELYIYIPIVQKYIGELITLVEYYQNDYNKFNTSNIVANFIGLQNKYQEYFYRFMHNLYLSDMQADEEDRIFESLLGWFNKFISFTCFVKDSRTDLKISLEELINQSASADSGVKVDKLLSELDLIIKTIEKKREHFASMDSLEVENDYMKSVRNKQIDKNWDKINSKVMNMVTSPDEYSNGMGINTLMGLNDDDLLEMNMELVELEEDGDVGESLIKTMKPVEFLKKLEYDHENGLVESDETFKKLDELGNSKWDEINKLSDLFGQKLITVIESFTSRDT